MLPTFPTPRARGLPSSPRARNKIDPIDVPKSPDISTSGPTASPISARLRKRTPEAVPSLANPPRTRPSRPDYRPLRKGDEPERAPARIYAQSNASSTSSSSTSSSLFSRGRQEGYTSSPTSPDDDEVLPKHGRLAQPKPYLHENMERSEEATELGRYDHKPATELETGYSIWNAVAAAASTLTISVSKAWAANVTISTGEETPPGQESHLTRAMKAYHLEKARDLGDLPEWLFPEIERPSATRSRFAPRQERDDTTDETPTPQSTSSRGLRDIYATSAAESAATLPPGTARQVVRADGTVLAASKATDRLKAIRDAKRSALVPNQNIAEPARVRPPQSTGLPRRPKG